MFKNFMLKQFFKSQLKNVPADQQEKMVAVIEKNPELFTVMGAKIQEKVKAGKDQMAAALEVAKEYEGQLKEVLK